MKILPAKPRYKCEFCGRVYLSAARCKQHEDICYFNPSRNCSRCENTGIELFSTLGSNLGVIFDGREEICSACAIAKQHGGKSYIVSEIKNEDSV